MALRFVLLGDPALVPLQSGSHLHLLEDITALLLARWDRFAWQGQGHTASGGEPHPGTLGFLSSPPNMPLSFCCPGSTPGPGKASLEEESHMPNPRLGQEGALALPLVLPPRAEMLMMSALRVPSQLNRQGSWGKGKHMSVTLCIYKGLRVTM